MTERRLSGAVGYKETQVGSDGRMFGLVADAALIASSDAHWRCSGATSQSGSLVIHVRPEAVSVRSWGEFLVDQVCLTGFHCGASLLDLALP